MVGLSHSITLSFMVVGHTKFTPDSCFGLVKQRYQRTNIECLSDIVNVVNKSGYINHARLVGAQKDQKFSYQLTTGRHISHLTSKRYKTLKTYMNLNFQQNIQERSSVSYTVTVKRKLDMHLDPLWEPNISDLPSLVQPRGLSPETQLYLYVKVRPFCTERSMDLKCPIPSYL